MKIVMRFEGYELKAQLNTSLTAKAFYARLPLTLVLEDYASNEKIAYLEPALSVSGSASHYARKGDITYYAPWGNLALFYKDFGQAPGLVSLGCFVDDVSVLAKHKQLTVEIVAGDS